MAQQTWETIATLIELPINDTNRLLVDVNKSDAGRTVIGIREWWTPDGEEWFPGKRGLSLRPEQWAKIIPALDEWLSANPPTPTTNGDAAPRGGGRKLTPPKRSTARNTAGK
jgi:hypothetical protein